VINSICSVLYCDHVSVGISLVQCGLCNLLNAKEYFTGNDLTAVYMTDPVN